MFVGIFVFRNSVLLIISVQAVSVILHQNNPSELVHVMLTLCIPLLVVLYFLMATYVMAQSATLPLLIVVALLNIVTKPAIVMQIQTIINQKIALLHLNLTIICVTEYHATLTVLAYQDFATFLSVNFMLYQHQHHSLLLLKRQNS